MAVQIVLVGLNHRTAPVELRERVAFSADQARRAAAELRTQGILEETLVLSTCNRSELYGVPPEANANGLSALEEFLVSFHGLDRTMLNGSLYRHRNGDVVRHVFRVAAGLDSMLLGEAEILGQLRDSYQAALEFGATGPVLNRMFQGALEVGKRVRTETEIGTRPVSVAFAGVKLAEQIFGKLKNRSALILGAGAVGEQVVERLRDRGIARVFVANRSYDRAIELAARWGGEAVEWNALEQALSLPDMVVSSVGVEEPILTRAMLERAMQARENRALFLIDLGVPRNVSPNAAELYNTYLYNIDDLSGIVEQNKQARAGEVPRVEAIIDEHVAKFEAWQAGVEVSVVMRELREKLSRERDAFLRERFAASPDLSPAERERLAQLATEWIEQFLLTRVDRLRNTRDLRRKLADLEAVRNLFGLDRDKS